MIRRKSFVITLLTILLTTAVVVYTYSPARSQNIAESHIETTLGKTTLLPAPSHSDDIAKDISKDKDKDDNAVLKELYAYPYSGLIKGDMKGGFCSNRDLVKLWSASKNNIKSPELVSKTAADFLMVNYNINYTDLKAYRNNMLYYFSSGSDVEDWLDVKIKDIKKYKIVSSAKVTGGPSLVYIDGDSEVRARCRLYIKYDLSTSGELLKELKLEADRWYYRDLDVLLTIGIDNGKWKRGQWTYLGCQYLSSYKVAGEELC